MGVQQRKQREKQELKRKILDAASHIIRQQGHEKCTIRRIAQQIEYSPRTIYLYFKDKDDLLKEIIETGFAYTVKKHQTERNIKLTSPLQMFSHYVQAHIKMAFENENYYRVIFYLMHEKGYPPGSNQQKIIKSTEDQLRLFFSKQDREKIDFTHLSFIIMNALRGFTIALLNRKNSMNKNEVGKIINQFINIIYQGILGIKI